MEIFSQLKVSVVLALNHVLAKFRQCPFILAVERDSMLAKLLYVRICALGEQGGKRVHV